MTIRACLTLPAGNETTRPYSLSIQAAWMLRDGIAQYVAFTRDGFTHGLLDAGECWLRTETATTEATKLRDWMVGVEPAYLVDSITALDALLAELASDEQRFAALFAEERARVSLW